MREGTLRPKSRKLRREALLACSSFIGLWLLVLLACSATDALMEIRSYVQGEGLWTRAQKEALIHLERFAHSGAEDDWAAYEREIAVTLGDRSARLELAKAQPDFNIVRQGYLAGRNNPEDIAGMIRVFQRFRNAPFMRKASAIWAEGDNQIDVMMVEADKLRTSLAHGNAPQASAALQRLRLLDGKLSRLESDFYATLADASRQISTTFKWLLVTLAAVLASLKFMFSWWTLRHQAKIENALFTSQEQFDLAVRGSNDGIWNWSATAETAFLSQRAVQLLGYPLHDLSRRPRDLLALVHPDDRTAVESAVVDMVENARALDVELRFLDWGGHYRWVHLRGRAVGVVGKQVHRAAGSITDISGRKRAEELARELAHDEQRQAEESYIALIEQIQSRIGRELHDDLGQRLTGVGFLVKAMEQRLATSTPGEAAQAQWIVTLVNESVDRARFLSRQLSPIEIDEISLAAALRRLVDDVQKIFGTRIALRISDIAAQSLTTDESNQFFRITQECISNSLRHGHATEITVCLDVFPDSRRLAIFDNGGGFQKRHTKSIGLGLRSMEIRARSLRGRLRMRSTTRGTTIIVRTSSAVENMMEAL